MTKTVREEIQKLHRRTISLTLYVAKYLDNIERLQGKSYSQVAGTVIPRIGRSAVGTAEKKSMEGGSQDVRCGPVAYSPAHADFI